MHRTAEWGLHYQRLTDEAGQTYARVLSRYQELLDRVALGELKAEHVQQRVAESLQEQSASATRDLVELSVGLVAGVFHVDARYREALLDGLLPPEPPPPPPPSPEGLNLTNWFQALSTYASQQSARVAGRHQALVDRVAAGEVSSDEVRARGRRFLEAQAPAFLDDMMDLGLTFVARLQRSSNTVAERVFDHVLGRSSGSASSLDPPITIELRGSLGAVVEKQIVVENTRSAVAEVECLASEMAARSSSRRFDSGIELSPAKFSLAPHGQCDVVLRLPLDPARFTAGADYVASVRVAGADEQDTVIHLLLRIEPPDAEMSA